MIKPLKNILNIEPYRIEEQDIWRDKKVKLKLDLNEGIFRIDKIEECMMNYIKSGKYTFYPDVEAYEIRKALSKFHKIDINDISVFNGSDEALDIISRCYLNHKEAVLIRNPEYSNFEVFARSTGAKVKYYYDKDPFVFDKYNLLNQLNKIKPKLFYLSNPNNPTGILVEKDIIIELITIYHEILFIIDEAYVHFAYKDINGMDSILRESSKLDNVVIVRTFSKLFSLAGLRIGYIVSNNKNIQIVNKIRKGKNVSMLSQKAAKIAIENWQEFTKYRDNIELGRQHLINNLNLFNRIKAYKSNTNFICIKVNNPKDFIGKLKEKGIYIRDRSHFSQLNNIVRITVPSLDQIEILIDNIKNII